ncbi:Cadherin-15 [Galemys pyrenaicus]|uniref:Cadherin-15 n=1 Tax=Galemys pyrenaicus TaxID=202257 RepID=A0A8J5ZV04_GALPY|nr:Cadherin-15 [Galemys pyrenaicus]
MDAALLLVVGLVAQTPARAPHVGGSLNSMPSCHFPFSLRPAGGPGARGVCGCPPAWALLEGQNLPDPEAQPRSQPEAAGVRGRRERPAQAWLCPATVGLSLALALHVVLQPAGSRGPPGHQELGELQGPGRAPTQGTHVHSALVDPAGKVGVLLQSLRLCSGVLGPRRPGILHPWRRGSPQGRVRRAWVIPPISVSENHKRLPHPLVQIKSDKQPLGGVIYSIQGPGVDEEPRGVFSIDKVTGKVFLNAALDREQTDRFRLRAFALDLGGSTLEEPTDLEIVVVDQNDNRPVFRQPVFTGRVLEGAAPGTYVTRAEATDADDPDTDNAALRFSILQQGGPQLFSIDERSGEIRTVQVGLDREVPAAAGREAAGPPHGGGPVLGPEPQPPPRPRSGPPSRPGRRGRGQGRGAGPGASVPPSAAALSRPQVVAVYNLTLQVADMSGDGLTATAFALISLDDVNDNAPTFTRDEVAAWPAGGGCRPRGGLLRARGAGQGRWTLKDAEQVAAGPGTLEGDPQGPQFSLQATEAVSGVDVGRLEVEDQDLPGSPNWAARFTIVEGDPGGHFAVRTDPKTNEAVLSVVKVRWPPPAAGGGCGRPACPDPAAGRAGPGWLDPGQAEPATGSRATGRRHPGWLGLRGDGVGTVHGPQLPSGHSGLTGLCRGCWSCGLGRTLHLGASSVLLCGALGRCPPPCPPRRAHCCISRKCLPSPELPTPPAPQPLDFEDCEQHHLTVAVQNEAPLQAAAARAERGQARVSVAVRDVNEPPVFPENPLRTSLAEGAAPGTPVVAFTAQDPDAQLQRLSYSRDYDPEDWLQVDGATGWVQTQRVLSRESPFLKDGWYRAIILARDDGEHGLAGPEPRPMGGACPGAGLPGQVPTRPTPAAFPPCTATGTLSIEILEVNDHAPELAPPSGSLCSRPDQGTGLLLAATDEDLPPHGAPFHFQLDPRLPELAQNWSLSQINVSHARLRLRHQLQEGLHRLSLLLRDSGQPPQQRQQPLNVTVCRCGQDGGCLPGTAALRARGAGISLGALVIMLASVILLLGLALSAMLLARLRRPPWDQGLLPGLQDELRDNILNYDEQGGGEEDQEAYDMDQLRHPVGLPPLSVRLGQPPLRRDAPYGRVRPQPPRALPAGPADIADFISKGLEAVDGDPSVPPYDTALIYDYEGDGSVASTLSSVLSSLGEEDQDYSCLRDWGPRFSRLADLYGPP